MIIPLRSILRSFARAHSPTAWSALEPQLRVQRQHDGHMDASALGAVQLGRAST